MAGDESRRYLIGANAELKLWGGFAVGADLLYRRSGFTQQFPLLFPTQPVNQLLTDRTRSHVLGSPVFGKCYFRREEKVSRLRSPLDIGVSIGGGIRWRFSRFSLVPEFRYTHWGGAPVRTVSKRQADCFLGIVF